MVKNNFPILWGLRHDVVVPFPEAVVEHDLHVGFEVIGVLSAGFVDLLENAYGHPQSGRGLHPFDELFGNLDAVKNHPLARACDVGKHAMLDRIVLGAIRRAMSDSQLDAEPVGEALQVFLEQVLRGAVAAASVAENQHAFRFGVDGVTVFFPTTKRCCRSTVRRCRAWC
jgi:hypothetical protein